MDYKDMGMKIKYLRQVQGLTQKELSEKIGTTWEMISRYETGKSSALQKISLISVALKTPLHKFFQTSSISDVSNTYNRNVVPLITKDFTKLSTAISITKSYYTAPDWIIQKFLNPFAIDAEILTIKSTHIDQKNGIIYATQEKPVSGTDLVISQEEGHLVISTHNSVKSTSKTIATVIAWEKRFR